MTRFFHPRFYSFGLLDLLILFLSLSLASMAFGYDRAIEGADNVRNKLYPRKSKFEVNIPNAGLILNQSYVDSFVLGGGIIYHMSEEWGVGFDGVQVLNSDKAERSCIEQFYNDPLDELGSVCGDEDELLALPEGSKANFGPAYVPIREIQNIFTLNAIWTPVYGKQLIFMSATSYFDLFFEFGLGLALSDFYPKQDTLRNGNQSRGVFDADGNSDDNLGAGPDELYAVGEDGRPDPESQQHVLANLGIGQKFHFGNRFHIKLYLRNMTLLGTDAGFDNLFVLYGGFGLRL